MILEYLNNFLALEPSSLPQIEVLEMNAIPRWIYSDWQLYQQALGHIIALAVSVAGQYGKVQIRLSYHEIGERSASDIQLIQNIEDRPDSDRNSSYSRSTRRTQKPSTWGYLLTDVKAFGDDSTPQVSLKDLLDPQRYDPTEKTSLGLICSKELILA